MIISLDQFKKDKSEKTIEELARLTGRPVQAIKYGYTYEEDRAWDLFCYLVSANLVKTYEEALSIIRDELNLY